MSTKAYPSREFSDQELKVSSFFVRNRERLRKIFIGSFIAVDAALILGSLIGGGYYIVTTRAFNQNINSLTSSLIDWQTLRPYVQSRPVTILEVAYVPSGLRTDFIARVMNENATRWSPAFRYRFTWQGGETAWYETFLLPGASRYLVALGVETIAPHDVRLETTALWSRISGGSEVGNASVADVVVVSGERFTQGADGAGGVVFEAENRGPFGYRNIGFIVGIKQGSFWSAVNYVTVLKFPPQAKRTLEARFFGRSVVQSGTIVIEPEVNLFDEDTIL